MKWLLIFQLTVSLNHYAAVPYDTKEACEAALNNVTSTVKYCFNPDEVNGTAITLATIMRVIDQRIDNIEAELQAIKNAQQELGLTPTQ